MTRDLCLFLQFFQGVFACQFRNILLQSFNGRQQLENHEENQNKSRQDDGVDVAGHADGVGYDIGEGGEKCNGCNATPNYDSHRNL